MAWTTEGVIDYPTRGQLMADTGAMGLGMNTRFTILMWGDSGADFELAVRDAANAADVTVQRLQLDPSGPFINEVPINVAVNQRVVIRSAGDQTGRFQASLLW